VTPRKYRRKRDPGLLDAALDGSWHVAAVLAVLALIVTVVVLPATFGNSRLLAPLGSMLQPLGWLFTTAFALIAAVKFLLSRFEVRPASFDSPPTAHVGTPSAKRPPATEVDTRQPSRPLAWSLELLQQIEWKRFEELVAAYLREAGYRVDTTRCGADGGVDAKVYKGDDLIAIAQCKAWNSRPVGVKPVRELLGVMAHERVGSGLFFATGDFTAEAIAFAQANPLTLVTGRELLANIAKQPAEAQARLLACATEGDYRTPTCPSCGIKMVERDGGGKRFWGCRNFPRCRQTFSHTR
jgi:restriction system protein